MTGKKKQMGARDTALSVLIACRRKQAWSDATLKEYILRDRLDRRDAAFATRLCGGVLQNGLLLDYWLSLFLKGKPSDLQPIVADILRLAVYQLRFMDRVPPSAAVNEAVRQCKKHANAGAAGLVNAVLRNMLRFPECLKLPDDLSVRYSHPQKLVELLRESVGEAVLETVLQADNAAPQTCVQVNTLRCDAAEAAEALSAEGYTVQPHPWLEDCLLISGGTMEQSRLFADGAIYVQDAAARLAALCSGAKPGDTVLDCCAAPGGKSLAAAIQMNDRGSVVSCDLHPHKIPLIEKNAKRLGLTAIHAMQADAAKDQPDLHDAFDVVIADVPCSGLGVIRKKPEIRYKDLSEAGRLPELQQKILNTQAAYVKPGGCLLYSTCTVLKRENEAVAERFLREHPDFSAQELPLPARFGTRTMLTLLPGVDETDGFFIAKFRRNT